MANTIINTPELLNLDSTTGATILAKGTVSERPATPTFSLDYLVVAGGGGGGGGVSSESPGAGGAGAVIYQAAGLNVIPSSEYTLYIADGGTGGGNNAQGVNGQDSYISFGGSNIVLAKGGGGGASKVGPGKNGGSGGGGTRDGDDNNSQAGGSAVTTNIAPAGASIYGNNGASGDGSCSGGGGGAGAVGTAPNGGNGVQINIDGNNYFWGGGGGACGSAGTGGQGGGGGGPRGGQGGTGGINPGASTGSSADGGGNAGANTGSGGGGATNPTGYPGGSGGSGIVILRYPNTQTITIGSGLTGTTATVGSDKVTTFTDGTGTISFSGTVVGGDNDATDGSLRFNTDTNKTEYFDGTGWYEIVDEYASGFIGPATNYFDTKLYTGNGSTQSIGGLNFQPGLTWVKARDAAHDHLLVDSVNGAGSAKGLVSNATYAQGEYTATYGYISSLNSNGFTVASGSSYANYTNVNNEDYVSWNWKAGGPAVANNDGTIAAQVSANKDSGFSIATYTGNGYPNAGTPEIGHGLLQTPEITIIKAISGTGTGGGTGYWVVGSSHVPVDPYAGGFYFNTNGVYYSSINYFWSGTPTNKVVKLNTDWYVNGSNNQYVMYNWHSVAGYSKIGSYTGNGNVSGPTITTNFEPSWVMVKRADSTGAWNIQDNKRNTTNPRNTILQADDAAGDITNTAYNINFDSTSFQIVNTGSNWNTLNGTYLYMAFA